MEIAGQMLFKQFIIKCIIVSLPSLIAICREMVRESFRPWYRYCTLHILALTQLLLLLSLLPAHIHMLQNTFSSSFVSLVCCLPVSAT